MTSARMYAVLCGDDDEPRATALFPRSEQAEAYIALAHDTHACVVRADVVGLLWNSHNPDPTEAP